MSYHYYTKEIYITSSYYRQINKFKKIIIIIKAKIRTENKSNTSHDNNSSSRTRNVLFKRRVISSHFIKNNFSRVRTENYGDQNTSFAAAK